MESQSIRQVDVVEKPKNFKIYSGKYIKKPHKEINDQ